MIRAYTVNRASQAIVADLDAPECNPLTQPPRFLFLSFLFNHLDYILDLSIDHFLVMFMYQR